MADAVLYSSLDLDGPGTSVPQPSIAGQNAVWFWHRLLKACLVDGYGTGVDRKDGQGWLMVDENLPNGFTLKAPDGVYYVWCTSPTTTHATATMCQLWMAETLTTPYTYPPTGINVRSGPHTNDYPADQRSYICGSPSGNPATAGFESWFILARGSQFIFHSNSKQSGIAQPGSNMHGDNTNYGDSTLFFGNTILKNPLSPKSGPQNSCVIGVHTLDINNYAVTTHMYGNYLRWGTIATKSANIRLRDPINGIVDIGELPKFYGYPPKHENTNTFRQSLSLYPPDLVLERADLFIDGVGSIGYIPGTFNHRYYNIRRFTDLMIALGRSGILVDALEPVVIDGDEFLFLPSCFGTAAFSLQEKYWV